MIKYIILLSIIGMSCNTIPNKKTSSDSTIRHKDVDLMLSYELPNYYKHEGTVNAYNLNGELNKVRAEHRNSNKEIIIEYYIPKFGQLLYDHFIEQLDQNSINKDYEKFMYRDIEYHISKKSFTKDGKGNTLPAASYSTFIDFYHKENGYYHWQIKQFEKTNDVDIKALIHSIQFLDAKNN